MQRKRCKIVIVFLIICCSSFTLTYNLEDLKDNASVSSLSNASATGSNKNSNIILMIGDGMGFEHLKLASWVEFGKSNISSIEELPFKKDVTTRNVNNEVTDSAASATAIATGHKTLNGFLSMLPTYETVETILEISRDMGKSTGAISKTEITHATPAAFMTHVSSRYETSSIVHQIIENSNVDVLMGGGSDYFSVSQLEQMESNGYNLARNITELQNIDTGKIFGLFASLSLPFEINRDRNVIPSLAEMTEKALEILSQNSKGFFLLVEGGKIDHAAHSNNKINVALETIDFYYAIEVALSFINNNENTLLITTADHETGGLNVLNSTLNNELPSINKNQEENKNLRIARANNISVSWSTTGHTNRNVPFYASKLGIKSFEELTTIDNTNIFEIMRSYLGLNDEKPLDVGLIIGISIGVGTGIIISVILFIIIRKRKRM